MELVMFSKMLKQTGGLSVSEAGDQIAELGFDGVDLTVRPGGHIAPEEAADRLPEAVEMFRGKGLTVPMITTGITSAGDPHAEEIFMAASDCGVDYLKLGYWGYDGFGTIHESLDAMLDDLRGVRELGRDYAVTPAIHTHSNDVLTANPAYVWDLLRSGSPDSLGMYVDPGHLFVEGSGSVWEMNMDLVREYIAMVSVKDPVVRQVETEAGATWEREWAPVGQGMVSWPRVFELLDDIGFDGPVSVHSEYDDHEFDELVDQTRADLGYLGDVVGR